MALVASMQDDGDLQEEEEAPAPQVVANSGGKEQEAREQSSAVDN